MRRLLIDYTDIIDIKVDKTHNQGLITLRDFGYLDISKKKDVVIRNRGKEFEQCDSVQNMIDENKIENVYAFNESNQLVFAVKEDIVKTLCDAGAYITGLELLYPMKEVVYTTGEDNATYDLVVKLSSTGEVLHVADNMSFAEIGNVMKILDNKLSLNSFGFDIFEIQRSLDAKK